MDVASIAIIVVIFLIWLGQILSSWHRAWNTGAAFKALRP